MPARILIVDDNPMNLKLARLVVTAEGHEADVAAGADEALTLLEEQRPDLILMDLEMPVVDGVELTRRLKADPATAAIPVIALTAAAMHRDRERATEAGCAGFVTKPLDTRGFAATLASYLPAEAA
jgi:CheY-like chemotaxis protein